MRILLVRPPNPRLTIGLKHLMACEPLELEYLAAALTDHEVQIIDLVFERGFTRRLREFQPDVVATTTYITGVNEAIRVCRTARRVLPGVHTVVGGVHAAVVPEDLADDAVDCIALTDGVSLLPELVEAWSAGRPLDEVPGLALPRDGAVVRTAERPYLVDADALPMPRRDLVRHLRRRYHYLTYHPIALVKTTWGCPHGCGFCFTRRITGGSVYSRSPELVADELERLNVRDVYIVDDDFFHDPERAVELAHILRRRGVNKRYIVYGRADFLAANEEIVRLWADIGLSAVLVGLEACSDDRLRELGKSTSADENRRAIQVLRRNHIDIHALFIPSPDWDEDQWADLARFIREEDLVYINLTPLTPYPGTRLFERYADQIQVPRDAHALWDMVHPVIPARGGVKTFYRRALRLYARTVLDVRVAGRAAHIPQPWPYKPILWRVLGGTALAALQMAMAHHHHRESVMAVAKAKGRPHRG